MFASLEHASFIDGNDQLPTSHQLEQKGADGIANAIRIPNGLRKQALHAIRSGFMSLFGDLPAVFALGGAQNGLQITEGTGIGFGSSKAGSQASV
jgi:hypothetical protein